MSSAITDFRSALVGAWNLVDYRAEPVEGDKTVMHPMGTNVNGIIMYSADGYMSAQLMLPGAPKFANEDMAGGTEAEFAAAMKRYLAYSGPFSIVEDDGVMSLTHTMSVCSFPNWLGNVQKRTAKMEDGVLTLTTDGPITLMGRTVIPVLRWRRQPVNGDA